MNRRSLTAGIVLACLLTTTAALPGTAAEDAGPVAMSRAVPVATAPTWVSQRGDSPQPWPAAWPKPVRLKPSARGALDGVTVAIDPGHNSGNARHIRQINRVHWVGLEKACNTTGTATSKISEAAYTFDVAKRLAKWLTAAGATVVMTRGSNATSTYGPCVGARGAFGGQQGADFTISIHADGHLGSKRGFHVIYPAGLKGYTTDIAKPSRRLATSMVDAFASAGFTPAQYLSSPLSPRNDQGTINMSDVPVVIVETLNMRAPKDAAIANTASGRQQIADALAAGARTFAATLGR